MVNFLKTVMKYANYITVFIETATFLIEKIEQKESNTKSKKDARTS
jgi:hypothetical protein